MLGKNEGKGNFKWWVTINGGGGSQTCQGAEIFKGEIFTFEKFIKVPPTMIGRLRTFYF